VKLQPGRRTGAAIIFCALLEGVAAAYDQRVHVLLSERAYVGPKTLAEAGATASALRERVYRAGAEASDPELRRRFLARFPSLDKFDAWAFKELLGLNPDKSVAGLDDTALPGGADGASVYGLASRLPDDDHRNRDRLRHDAERHVVSGPYGPLPDDPATLEMGGLTGLSSQAHAHYQLPKLDFSDSPEVLKTDPRRFAVPPTVHTFGAAYAEVYTALAALALRLSGGERLALTHAGAAAHHIEDIANQIHTVQVGLYDFFVDAKLQSIKEELLSVGGLLRERPGFVSIGIDIISNHHTLAEALYQKHLLAAGDPVREKSASAPLDPEFASALEKIPPGCRPGFARAIVFALADRSSHEGPEVYGTIRAAALPRFSRAGQHFEDTDDPDAAIKPGADLTRFYDLEARGAKRSDQALAAWWQRFAACGQLDAKGEAQLAEALVRDRLDALDEAEARARAYQQKRPEKASINGWIPAIYLGVIGGLAFVVQRTRRRRRKDEG
jgi:hypothetical protein